MSVRVAFIVAGEEMSRVRRTLVWSLAGLGVNALTALATSSCWVAYASGDPSGIQYLALFIGLWFAVAAGAGAVALRRRGVVPVANLLMPPLAAGVCLLPYLVRPWQTGWDVDRMGQNAVLGVLAIQAVVAAYAPWWLWRRQADRARN